MRLTRLARWCFRRRRLTVALWLATLVLAVILGAALAADTVDNFDLPGTDSQQAYDTLSERFPQEAGDTVRLVFAAADGVDDPAVRAAIDQVVADSATIDQVVSVIGPLDDRAEFAVSPDRTVAFATVVLNARASEVDLDSSRAIRSLAESSTTDFLVVEAGGEVIQALEDQEVGFGLSEGIGLLAAVFILLFAFRSLLAMGLPILTALIGIGIGLSLVAMLGNLLEVPSFAAQVATMIGIGVGIDYALFIVTRYRSGLSVNQDPEAAMIAAIATSGRAVMFAGSVVVISLLSMLVMDFVVVRGVALSAAAVVLLTMLASVTLLPALLGFTGRNINRFQLPGRTDHTTEDGTRQGVWFRWSRVIQRRPAPIAAIGALVLIVLSLPLFWMRLGVSDAGNGSEERSSRRAYDLLAEGFGPGFNGPFLLVVDTAPAGAPLSDPAVADELVAALRITEGVAAVSEPQFNPSADTAVVTVIAESAPQDRETDELLARIRNDVVPPLEADSGAEISVGGITASFVDFGDKIGARLPIFIAVVLILSFLLLTAVFRAVLVAIKAAILNLLSISAAYGIIVAVFQWGWFKDVFGVAEAGPIESWVPMMMFAIMFGLSMDYEVFLLSRIREEYSRTGDNALAVADGLASTARVITAAAAIMIAVFMSFVFGDERVLKPMGLGLASAIFVDATIVRLVLVPSTMELLGDRNWWIPTWLDRLLPELHAQGDTDAAVIAPPEGPAGEPSGIDEGHTEVVPMSSEVEPVSSELEPGNSPPDDRAREPDRWAVRAFRIPITIAAVVLFNQSLQAGEFMSGKYEFLQFHRYGATLAEFVVLFALIGAGWALYRGRYQWWPVGVTALLFVAIQVQEWAGEQRVLSVHVPLGVSIIVVAIGLTVWAWREA